MIEHPSKRAIAAIVGLGVAVGSSMAGAPVHASPGAIPRPVDEVPGVSIFDPNHPERVLPDPLRPTPGIDGPKVSPSPKADDKGGVLKTLSRQDKLDMLFGRLAGATDPDEASGIASVIEQIWMHSGSDTADLLMTRAVAAMGSDHRDIARDLLDRIIDLDPDWAEAWNKRATLKFLEDDDAGSMEDISHALVLEPRHFGALSGLGFILQRNGMNKAALTALRKALDLYPESPDIRKVVDQLVPEVEGRDL